MGESNADRAAVAREATLRLVDEFEDAGTLLPGQVYVLREYINREHPAPPAPETVTVDGVTYEQRDDICKGGWYAFGTAIWPDEWKGVALTRIASGARVIAELETQLEETARSRDGWQSDALREAQNAEFLRSERDAALRALEAYQNGIGPMGSKGEGCGEVGVSTAAHGGSGATQPDQGESPVAAPSPAPIPLGETMEVDGVKWARTELGWNGGAWRYHDSSTVARVLTALYRARHPVATRETVERVASVIDDTHHGIGAVLRYRLARAALTAAGFTLEEGA